jgi:hypothetical protein
MMKIRTIADGYVGTATVKITRSPARASVWSPGDGLWWVNRSGRYEGLLLAAFNRTNNTRWSIWIEVEADTWEAVKRAVRALGWTAPRLRASDLKGAA